MEYIPADSSSKDESSSSDEERQSRQDEIQRPVVMREPPEISWENTLGAPNGVPFDDETKALLRDCLEVSMSPPTTLAELMKRSDAFPIPFPINTIRCSALKSRGIGTDVLEMNANSVYPLIHEGMLPLIAGWLKYKRQYGSSVEKAMYKNMGLIQFIQRLLEKRTVCFFNPSDSYKLIDNTSGEGGWESVGTDEEKEPLVLAKVLSYDEIKLSAMMVLSSHTVFINDGSRENRGVVSPDPESIQPRGVIMGPVGSRFEKPQFMEYQDIIITPLQNNMDNGYGPAIDGTTEESRGLRVVWAKFYGEEYHPLYEEAMRKLKSKENKRYILLTNQLIFDIENYMKRTLLSVEIILLEANTRAEKQNTTAFIHVVGFGLGVWRIMQDQEIYFLKTFEIAIRKMNKKLKYVSDIMFSYFRSQKCGDVGNGDYLGDIKIHFALREPHSRLIRSTDANKLLVVTYAADGNSLPGNCFWQGYLASSGDPAAACSTQIAELHTQRINSRELISPLGPSQRRPSRSPRSQRSRSADVDCLKKYTERRVEERRLTEAGDPSRLDSLKWIPLSKNVNRLRSSTRSHQGVPIRNDGGYLENERAKIDSTRWLPIVNRKVCPENIRRKSNEKIIEDGKYVKLPAGRSLSNESTFSRRDNYYRERNNTESGYYRRESCDQPRWLQSETSTSRYIPSPLARKYSEGSTSKPMSNRWMTFTRYPSPSPIVRRNTERRSYTSDTKRSEINWSDRSKENMKSFSTSENKAVQASWDINSARLSQRIRELYDIKTETEFPKRLNHRLRENAWISKSSSEEEKYPTRTGRRNSQELEFNDRSSSFNQSEDKPEVKSQKCSDSTFDNDWDERLRKFHEKLRFSEDLSIDQKIRARDRRTYSDDYEDLSRRQSRDEYFLKDIKRNSDASSKSRVSYAEIDFSDMTMSKKGSRTSDASYVSISTFSSKRGSVESKNACINTYSPKRGSIEDNNVSKNTFSPKSGNFEAPKVPQIEKISQSAFCQLEERRPSTPVPPKEMNNSVQIEKPFSQRNRRNSTRYKVYLT